MNKIDTIVFDLGGVLIDWDPRHLYRQLFDDTEKMEWFLENICHSDWNMQQDAGRPFADAVAELVGLYPDFETEIRAFHTRWIEMIGGPMPDTVVILEEAAKKGFRLFALTNWSAETFPLVRHEYELFDHFQEIVVSGEEKIAKPDPKFFQLLMDRHQVVPEYSLFIDDNKANIDAANQLGFHTVWFKSADDLRKKMNELALL